MFSYFSILFFFFFPCDLAFNFWKLIKNEHCLQQFPFFPVLTTKIFLTQNQQAAVTSLLFTNGSLADLKSQSSHLAKEKNKWLHQKYRLSAHLTKQHKAESTITIPNLLIYRPYFWVFIRDSWGVLKSKTRG